MFKVTYWFLLLSVQKYLSSCMYKELYVFNIWTSWVLRWVCICETIMPIYVVNISPPNDSSCPEKSYVLGNKICQFFALWVGGLQGHLSALLLTGCSPSLIPSLPSATITIFLSVALTYVSSVFLLRDSVHIPSLSSRCLYLGSYMGYRAFHVLTAVCLFNLIMLHYFDFYVG